MIQYVLFDFDGTLVDSREVFISAFNQIANKYGFKKIDPDNLPQLRKMSMMERLRFLKVPTYKLPFATREFLSLYRTEIASLSLIAGMESILEKVQDLGLKIGIISSNSVATIKTVLENNGISAITDIYCSGQLFGKDRIFRQFLKEKKVKRTKVLYVCDELRDIEACNKMQITPIWVTWGFEGIDAIQPGDSLHVAQTPGDLFTIIQEQYPDALKSYNDISKS